MVYPPTGSRPIRKGDEHPAYTPRGAWHTLPLPISRRTSAEGNYYVDTVHSEMLSLITESTPHIVLLG